MPTGQLFIGGAWRPSVSGETYQTINPATEEPSATVARGDERDIDLAVAAARKAFDGGPWPRMTAAERGRIVWKLGDLITQNLDEMARLESLCTGKTLFDSGKVEIPFAAEVFRYYAGWATKIHGETPNLVFADADMDAAVKGAMTGIFYNKGEVCAAGSRLFVEEKIHNVFVAQLTEKVKGLKVGDPMDRATRMGPVVSKQQMETVLGYIETGKKEGARLVAGGGRANVGDGKGYFVEPTIFDGVTNTMRIAREEIFGPVLSVIPFKSVEEGIAEGNQTTYGLAAAVWTRDVAKALKAARAIRAGTVWVNAYNLYDAALPFGGFRESGFGREMGSVGLEHYTEVKTVWVDLS